MKITNLVRSVPILSASSTSSVLTIVTTVGHGLVTSDLIALDTNNNKKYVVTVIDTVTFTIPAVIYSIASTPFIPVGVVYPLGLISTSGISLPYPLGTTNDSMATFQTIGKTSSGTGSATIVIEVSINGINWLTFGTITLVLGTAEISDGLVIAAPWAYARANCTSITGTGGKVTVLMGRGS